MGGYVFRRGFPRLRLEVYLIQVFSRKQMVNQIWEVNEGSKRLARFSLSKVLGLLRWTERGWSYGLERYKNLPIHNKWHFHRESNFNSMGWQKNKTKQYTNESMLQISNHSNQKEISIVSTQILDPFHDVNIHILNIILIYPPPHPSHSVSFSLIFSQVLALTIWWMYT